MARQMKDSGIEWIGEIPCNWRIMKMNMICAVVTDYVASGSFADLAVNVTYLDEPDYAMLVRTADVSGKGHVNKPVFINQHAYEFLSNSNLVGGEIILPNIGGVGEAYLVPKLYEHMSLAPNAIMIKTNYCDKFYYYYFNSDAGSKPIINISQSTAQAKFNKTDFKQIRALVPPQEEQKAIADFLDCRCAEIDAVIERTKATIEEYKKLKQAVITEAVTKGVRGPRKMKDSGIEWIGEIPEGWEVSRVKYVSDFEPSSHRDDLSDESIITYTPMDCIKNGWFINNTAPLGSVSSSLTAYQEGDIVLAKVTPCFENGNIAIMNGLVSGFGLGSSELFVIRTKSINTKYMFYWLQNKEFMQQACATMTGTGGLKRVSPSFVKDCFIHMPSSTEQAEIAAYLDEKCAALDTLIAKKTALLTELESYKKSLIYEYVTGKKEVL